MSKLTDFEQIWSRLMTSRLSDRRSLGSFSVAGDVFTASFKFENGFVPAYGGLGSSSVADNSLTATFKFENKFVP